MNDNNEQQLRVEICDSLDHVDGSCWNRLEIEGNPFLRYEFLLALEKTGCLGKGTGWYPRYFLIRRADIDSLSDASDDTVDDTVGENADDEDNTTTNAIENTPPAGEDLIAACACYIKTNSFGEFVFDWAWADAYERHGLDYYPKLVGAIPFTPASGPRLLVKPGEQSQLLKALLGKAVLAYCREEGFSSMHWLFLTEQDHDQLVSEEHLSRLDCQYHWQNDNYTSFDDFLSKCNSKRRKTIRRERRYVSDANLRLERRLGSTLTAHEWELVHKYYCTTFDKKWGNPSLTLAFFEQIGQQFGDNCLIVFAYSTGVDPIAVSVMFFGETTLYGRYWGVAENHHCLHFEACYYQGIEFAIERKLQRFEPGAQGEHKITRGFEPVMTYSAHWLADAGFRGAIENYLAQERPLIRERRQGLEQHLPFRMDTGVAEDNSDGATAQSDKVQEDSLD